MADKEQRFRSEQLEEALAKQDVAAVAIRPAQRHRDRAAARHGQEGHAGARLRTRGVRQADPAAVLVRGRVHGDGAGREDPAGHGLRRAAARGVPRCAPRLARGCVLRHRGAAHDCSRPPRRTCWRRCAPDAVGFGPAAADQGPARSGGRVVGRGRSAASSFTAAGRVGAAPAWRIGSLPSRRCPRRWPGWRAPGQNARSSSRSRADCVIEKATRSASRRCSDPCAEHRREPSRAASLARCFAPVAGRISPARLISPTAASVCGYGRSRAALASARAIARSAPGSVSFHAADRRHVHVGIRELQPRSTLEHGEEHRDPGRVDPVHHAARLGCGARHHEGLHLDRQGPTSLHRDGTHVPDTGVPLRDMNSPLGSGTSWMPSPAMSKQPTSSVGPKRFLSARTKRSAVWRSPSKWHTTSTGARGAGAPAIVRPS